MIKCPPIRSLENVSEFAQWQRDILSGYAVCIIRHNGLIEAVQERQE